MKLNLFNSLVLAATAAADSCTLIDGMYYCNEVKQVQYEGIGFSGSYNRVTSMNNGQCSSEPQAFSGSLSPLDEEISLHFRGPLHLFKFAAYTPSSSGSSKREVEHHHHHKREPVFVTQIVQQVQYVTVDGEGNLHTETATSTSASVETSSAHGTIGGGNSNGNGKPPINNFNYNGLAVSSATGPSTVSTTSAAAATQTVSGSSDWSRTGYYDSESGTRDGLVFLNNLGGSGSGVFDYSFGNSLSYAGADGESCSGSAQTLKDTTLPSNKEVIIFTDNECKGDECGFYREGIPAYHGFGGSEKIFLLEFSMPSENGVDRSTYNYDMPAIWALNAQIPRTLQYGNAECSCWGTGCGELDLFEVLSAGNSKCTTTLHTKQGGAGKGSADYFARPTSGSIKAAVIFNQGVVTITEIDSNVDFSADLDDATINGWISATKGSSSSVQL